MIRFLFSIPALLIALVCGSAAIFLLAPILAAFGPWPWVFVGGIFIGVLMGAFKR